MTSVWGPRRPSLPARIVIAAAAMIACVAMRLPAGSFAWTSQGPWGGSISALASAPSDPSTIYAGTYLGRVYRSDDGGTTWTRGSDIARTNVQALAVDPADSQAVYVATGAGLFKSVDGGGAWFSSLSAYAGYALAVDPSNPQTVFASISAGGSAYLFRSVDAGVSWADVSGILLNLGVRAIVIDPASTVYVGTSGGVFQSPDLGQTWLPSSNGLTAAYVQDLVLDPSDSAILYAATDTGGVFKSTDHAASWSPVNTGLPYLYVSKLLATSFAVFAAVGSTAVFQTIDGGATWTATGPGLPDPVLANALAPGGPGAVFAGTSRGFFRSMNSGATWESSDTGLSGNAAFSLAVSSATSTVFAGMDTGFFQSADEGQTWNGPANEGLGSLPIVSIQGVAVDPTDDQTLYASVVPCCGLYKTINGGENWAFTGLSGLFLHDLAVDPTSPEIIYALNSLVGVYKSTAGGTGWSLMNSGIPAGDTFGGLAMDPNTPATLYTTTQPLGAGPQAAAAVYKSTDGAASWNPASAGVEGQILFAIVVAPSDSSTVYAGGQTGFFATFDGGIQWTPAGPGLPPSAIYAIAVDPLRASTVYVATADSGVYRSRDAASTWEPLNTGLTDLTVYELTTDASGSALYAGTTSGVFDYRLSFLDVPPSDQFHDAIDTIAVNGITSGCGDGNYCPDAPLSRAQSAVFVLRGLHGGGFQPPPATGLVFSDVPSDGFAAAWIEELAAEGITSGCGGGHFCPDAALTRAEAAVFLLRAKHDPTYAPPPATGTVFTDVPADAFAADWIEELAAEGITFGCGGGNYCPGQPTSRGQAAALLVRTFGLQ